MGEVLKGFVFWVVDGFLGLVDVELVGGCCGCVLVEVWFDFFEVEIFLGDNWFAFNDFVGVVCFGVVFFAVG